MKTGCSFPPQDLHAIILRLVSSFSCPDSPMPSLVSLEGPFKKKFNCAESSLLHEHSLVSESGDYSLDMVSGLLIAMASLVADHRIYGLRSQFLWPIGLVALKI